MGATTSRETGNIRSLHPVRILLAAADSRFVRAAAFLLDREGFEVVGACRPDEAAELARAERPHAVIVDGNPSVAAAGRTALALDAAGLPLHVLVVSSGETSRSDPLARTSECGSFVEVTRELRRLYGT